LDRAAVVAAAAVLADAEGLEALSVARLAADFGVRPPTLHHHVGSLPELRRELALRGLRELLPLLARAAAGRAGEAAVEGVAHAYRAYARAHPGLFAAARRAPAAGDAEWNALGAEVVGVLVAALSGYGLTGDDALHAVRGFRSVVDGFVSLETGGGFGLALDADESFRRLLRAYTVGLRRDHPVRRPKQGGVS
jgi:AcrR family transcriptional regulator